MKRLSAIFTAGIILFLSSCNDSSKDKEEAKPADSTAMAPAPTPPAPKAAAFSPFKLVVIKHKVKDFAKWLPVYLGHDSMRMAYGISKYRVGRGLEDSNIVVASDIITDVQKAKDFGGSASLKDAMQKAGVIGKPEIAMYDVIRTDSGRIDNADRLSVTHKVKDFAAWLKVYDEEGKAKRTENGLVDRALERSIDDSNTVRIIFAVTDMAKAKARTASPELKKIMEDAGVVGKPDIFWYKIVQ